MLSQTMIDIVHCVRPKSKTHKRICQQNQCESTNINMPTIEFYLLV